MKTQFTEMQQQAIDLRGKNILVSAAAGSGKTAVLVERIIKIISEGKNPADIDRLLVVTFTSAAASEMRERIISAVSKRLAQEPENEHLQRQSALIHNAQITTIHSFCLFVIRNHFQEIGLDPAFRIADEGEISLLLQEVLGEVLEEAFGELEQAGGDHAPFRDLVEAYSTGKKETVLEESILSLYRFAMSYPWPKEWLLEHGKDYEIHSGEELEKAPFIRYMLDYLSNMLPELAEQLTLCRQICEEPDGPYMYGENIENTLEGLERAACAETYAGYREALMRVDFGRLSAKKDTAVNSEKREYVKQIRNGVKKQLEQLREQFFQFSEEAVLIQCARVSPIVQELTDLVIRFIDRLSEKKREKNLIDFTDMEHLALDILCKKEGQGAEARIEPTAAALELRDYFQEIMIDEYQDSNLVQECILSCISGEDAGHYNRFMVGDVKQSIYKFRLARPELFMEKFHTYSGLGDACQRIDLYQNFRSRQEVIDSVNLIFSQLLAENLGGIDYDERSMLHYGAVYYDEKEQVDAGEKETGENGQINERQKETGENGQKYNNDNGIIAVEKKNDNQNITEFLLIEKSVDEEKSAVEEEAKAIAFRIRRLLKENKVLDKESGCLRPVRYGDIVILLRSSSGIDEVYQEVLGKHDIPCFISSRTGYFQTSEVQVLLQLLRVLDNPLQDIPLFGVLKSCFGDFTEEELAKIAAIFPGRQRLYRKLKWYAEFDGNTERKAKEAGQGLRETEIEKGEMREEIGGEKGGVGEKTGEEVVEKEKGAVKEETGEEIRESDLVAEKELQEKCNRFLHWYEELRSCAVWLSIRELLQKIMEEGRYLEYVTALPGGEQRRANAEMLLQKAAAFEKTSFKGLYHFIRYIDQMEKYSMDYGEANTLDESSDVVRIMTIHKSKGLEFPVCIVAGMGRKMNRRDASAPVLTDMDMGVAVDLVDPVLRIRQRTLRKAVLARKILLDSQAEELRVLYVALTRAKEKLIITGVTNNAAKEFNVNLIIRKRKEVVLPYSVRSGAPRFLELILASVIRTEGIRDILEEYHVAVENSSNSLGNSIFCKVITAEDMEEEQSRQETEKVYDTAAFQMKLKTGTVDAGMQRELQERFGYHYPFEHLQKLYAKTTVSELKMAAIRNMAGQASAEFPGEEADSGKHLFEEETVTPYLPAFLRKEEKEEGISGAARGSAMHRVMELIDFTRRAEILGKSEKLPSEAKDKVFGEAGLEDYIRRWCSSGLLTEEYAQAVNRKKILRFMESPLAGRMERAAKNNKLKKEQPFMLGIGADRLSAEFPETERVLVQGIIDVFFEEDGEIVLLDYKTDVIKESQELADRYRVQLDYYAEALERIIGKRVKERILYSFYLGIPITL